MEKLNEKLSNEQREFLLELYVEGLDEVSDEKVAKVLKFTLYDEVLDAQIDEVNSFYAQELGFDNLAQTVVGLADEHLQTRYEEVEFEAKILTFGDVAKKLEAKNRVPQGEEENNRQLAENNTPLPDYLSLAEIKRIAGRLKLKFKEKYWSPFFKEATFLTLRESQQQAFATRAKRPRKGKEKSDESSEKTKNK